MKEKSEMKPASVRSAQARLGPRVEFKAVRHDAQVDFKERVIEGYASIANVVDLGGDVVLPGAFKSTIKERGPKGNQLIKGFLNHEDLIGMPEVLEEDSSGLRYVLRVFPSEFGPITDQALVGVREGGYAHSSFAYDVEEEMTPDEAAGFSRGTKAAVEAGGERFLKRLKLFELGPVIWPMNEAAKVLSAKNEMRNLEAELKQALEAARGGTAQAAPSAPKAGKRRQTPAPATDRGAAGRSARAKGFLTAEERAVLRLEKDIGQLQLEIKRLVRWRAAATNNLQRRNRHA